MAFLSWFIETLLQWYVWLPIVLILAYLTWRNYQQVDAVRSIDSVLLIFEIPKINNKRSDAAEHMFAGLHDTLRDSTELRQHRGIQEHMSFEVVAYDGGIRFYAWVPKSLQSFIEGQIQAQYPAVQVYEAQEDYIGRERRHSIVYNAEITLTNSEMLPIKTYPSLEPDSLVGLTATLGKLGPKEEMWIQVLARPIANDWHDNSKRWVNSVKNGSPFDFLIDGSGFDFKWLGSIFAALWKPPQSGGPSVQRSLSERDAKRCADAEKKAEKDGFKVRIRVVYLGESQSLAKQRMQAMIATFKHFNNIGVNGFKLSKASFNKEDLSRYKSRLFLGGGFILNNEELASIFHLPHDGIEAPNVTWLTTETETEVAEPLPKLPIITGNEAIDENISAFGMTTANGINHQFGLLRNDRSRHVYIIGQTGAGKTATLELLALSDIYHRQGYAIIDPHGDFAISNLRFLPGSRLQDVVYFNPADTSWPLGFNPLEINHPDQKSTISSELIGVFKRMFADSWGPRLEYILRYTILALLDRPQATMLDITRMLTDKKFREETLTYCQDAVVLQFWQVEFSRWNDKFQTEAIAPVLNKVGAFTANPVIRNIVGQPKSTFNIREIMDNGKILIVNLSKGLIGEDNAAILGSLLVTKIQIAAMSRSDIPDIADRRPFYLYVDEFQNFATDSFATILSEARKYGLNLTVANQYISQMTPTVRDAVFGNVGTVICFRVSGDDASLLARQFEPQFGTTDLVKLDNRHFISTMVIDGEKVPAFSATTLELPSPQLDNINSVIEHTRHYYAQERGEVEKAITASLNAQQPITARHQQPRAAVAPPAPISAIAPPPLFATAPAPMPAAATALPSEHQSHRKKRTRSHKKKAGQNTTTATPPQPNNPIAPVTPVSGPPPRQQSPLVKDPTKLRIRHHTTPDAPTTKSTPASHKSPVTIPPKPPISPKKHEDESILRIR